MAQKKLWKSVNYNNFTVEVNERLAKEEESQLTASSDVTRVKRRDMIRSSQQEVPQHSDDEDEQGVGRSEELLDEATKAEREQLKDKASLYFMCSVQEREERQSRMLVDIFEQDPRTAHMQPHNKWMIKSYLRTNVDNTSAENVRPPDVLLLTTKYIVNKVLDANFYLNIPFKYPRDKNNKRRSHTFEDIFLFAGDRFKAIRQDITILNQTNEKTIYALEMITRFYGISFYECQATATQYDPKILADDFSSSLTQLLNMYQDQQTYNYPENIYEMQSYALLFHARDRLFINSFLPKINNVNHPKISEALKLVDGIQNLDYFNFFQRMRGLNYIECCLAFVHFQYMRDEAIKIMRKARLRLTVQDLQELLFFESPDQTLSFLKSQGIDVAKLNAPLEQESDSETENSTSDLGLPQDKEEESIQKKDEREVEVSKNQQDLEENTLQETKESSDIKKANQTSVILEQENKEEQKDSTEEGREEKGEEKLPKKYRVKKVYIDWKKQNPENNSLFIELNSKISEKKSVEFFPSYKQRKTTNNENIVTRAYLVSGINNVSFQS